MAMAVIDEIASQIKQSSSDTPGGYISYFFCQGAIPGLNDAISALQGLIFVLIDEHPELVDPLRQALRREGSRLFEGNYGLHALWVVLQHILEDERVPRVYLVIDALDECNGLQDNLLLLLTRNARDLPKKVKWIVTSRNEPQIKKRLENDPLIHHTSLELNSDHVTEAVREFIQVKVEDLNYDSPLREEVESYLTANADGTFLWVALVCQRLESIDPWETLSELYNFPPKLEPLYDRMLDQIEHLRGVSREYCIKVLRMITLAYRPLYLGELVFVAELPEEQFSNSSKVAALISRCGSFLTIRDERGYFVHQSAKDFLSGPKGHRVFPTSQKDEHCLFALRLLGLMSRKLKRNICDLDHPGVEDVEPAIITQYISGALEYSCRYWVDHSEHGQVSLNDDGPVYHFLREYCPYWLEAMSLIGKIPEAIAVMIKLESFLDVSTATGTLGMYFNVRLRRRKLLSCNPWSEIHYGSCAPSVTCSLKHPSSYIVLDSSSVHLTASFGSRSAYRQQEMSRL